MRGFPLFRIEMHLVNCQEADNQMYFLTACLSFGQGQRGKKAHNKVP